jgi:hypothetical protein
LDLLDLITMAQDKMPEHLAQYVWAPGFTSKVTAGYALLQPIGCPTVQKWGMQIYGWVDIKVSRLQ